MAYKELAGIDDKIHISISMSLISATFNVTSGDSVQIKLWPWWKQNWENS